MSAKQVILILDFGSQYTQLIARRVREQNVYSEIHPFNLPLERIRAMQPTGIILSVGRRRCTTRARRGSPPRSSTSACRSSASATACSSPACSWAARSCRPTHREYGRASVHLESASELFHGFSAGDELAVWMSHGDRVDRCPRDFAASAPAPTALRRGGSPERKFWGVQFHPEVAHTPRGMEILGNFLFRICKCQPSWTMANFVDEAVATVKRQAPSGRVICGLSGGVDSSVAASLVQRAVGDRLTCIFVDNGLLRAREAVQVERCFAAPSR
jgi:GMP synthase (glutamine-hydrolysing)